MKKLLLICLLISFAAPINAKIKKIENKPKTEDAQTIGNINDIPPAKVAKIQRYTNKSIEDMVKNMPDKDLKEYVKALNKAEIQAAKRAGRKIPPVLDEKTLNDKDKIKEYLRSSY